MFIDFINIKIPIATIDSSLRLLTDREPLVRDVTSNAGIVIPALDQNSGRVLCERIAGVFTIHKTKWRKRTPRRSGQAFGAFFI